MKNLENTSLPSEDAKEQEEVNQLLQDLDGASGQPLPDLQQNPELPGLCTQVELTFNDKVGRHLLAREDIKVGDIIGDILSHS